MNKNKVGIGLSVYSYWGQGIANMPDMIKCIYEHNVKMSRKYNFTYVLLDDTNITDYINPHKRYESLKYNFKSDIVRYYVLHKYGGVWLDADILILKNLNELYDKFVKSGKTIMLDMENNRADIGCASIFMIGNSTASEFCYKYVNKYLDYHGALRWSEIGPKTVIELYKKYRSTVLLNMYETTQHGCNYLTWNEDPGINKSKWLFNSSDAAKNVAEKLLSNKDCFYLMTWTIYRKNNINTNTNTNLCDFVFGNTKSMFYYVYNQTKNNYQNINNFTNSIRTHIPTFNVLIATTGRPTLQNMINSLANQLTENDCLTIVFDGTEKSHAFDYGKLKCKVSIHNEKKPLGHHGHAIRNVYSTILEKRDFILHADDDDIYTNCFSALRKQCIDPKQLYICYMKDEKRVYPLGFDYNIKTGNIGTPCGIIPYELNKKCIWEYTYGGDGDFYQQLVKLCTPKLLTFIIYIIRPNNKQMEELDLKVKQSVETVKGNNLGLLNGGKRTRRHTRKLQKLVTNRED